MRGPQTALRFWALLASLAKESTFFIHLLFSPWRFTRHQPLIRREEWRWRKDE